MYMIYVYANLSRTVCNVYTFNGTQEAAEREAMRLVRVHGATGGATVNNGRADVFSVYGLW